MHLYILKCINSIIKCYIVLYSYFPYVMSVHNLCIYVQNLKNICVYFIHLQTLKYIYVHISVYMCMYLCIYTYRKTLISKPMLPSMNKSQ